MTMIRVKDPDAIELFGFDFGAQLMANRLGVAAITGHQVMPVANPDGSMLTVEATARNGAEVTARLGGGAAGQTYWVIFELRLGSSDVLGPIIWPHTMRIRVAKQ